MKLHDSVQTNQTYRLCPFAMTLYLTVRFCSLSELEFSDVLSYSYSNPPLLSDCSLRVRRGGGFTQGLLKAGMKHLA